MAQAMSTAALGRIALDCCKRRSDDARPVTTTLAVENMHCGGCMRKVESALAAVPGVATARVNLSARRVTACTARGVNAADLVDALPAPASRPPSLPKTRGPAKPVDRDLAEAARRRGVRRRQHHAAVGVGVVGQRGDMTPSVQALFHWLSALIALPAVAYAGQPFFRSAAQALRARRLNMDVPISLGVTLATAMSLYQTTRGSQQVYFDAAVTLLFFLLVGRYLDQRMRARAAGAAANLIGLRGATATIIQLRRHHRAPRRAAAGARHAHPHRRGRALRGRRPRARRPRRGRREPDHRRDGAARRLRRAPRSMPARSTCRVRW